MQRTVRDRTAGSARQEVVSIVPGRGAQAQRLLRGLTRAPLLAHAALLELDLGDLYAESGQTLQGSFSAVSKPIFSNKDSFESSRRDLQDLHLCVFWEKRTEIENGKMKMYAKY